MSDTPRTDKHEDGRIGSPLDLSEYERVLQFARTLERENAELVEALQAIRKMTEGATGGMHGDIYVLAVTALAKLGEA